MEIVRHADVAEFDAIAGGLLAADPVRHTMAVTLLASLRAGRAEPGALVTAHDAGRLVGAALQTAGFPLVVTALPVAAAGPVATALRGEPMSGVFGPVPVAEAFADAWAARTGGVTRVAMPHRLFRLGELTPPDVAGAARLVTDADVDLVARWRLDFAEEAMGGWETAGPSPRDLTLVNLAAGHGLLLWEDGGEPVALAIASAPVFAMSRVSSVWTPRHLRGRGYGSAVTAAASRWALDAGARHVVLFTDTGNPTSNAIYPRIGYVAVGDATSLRFGPA